MALTAAEQKLLDELEKTLTDEDPKLAVQFTRQPQGRAVRHPAKAAIGALGFVIGLAALVVGLSSYWWISVVGFVLMLVSVAAFISTWSKPSSRKPSAKPVPPRSANQDFVARMEQRWRDRQEE